ncbi:hypothetical protein TSUD_73790 [Trifolium subterraneum]|uniref:Myb-like domain-containing protein n=1 Tax=Trifolium subterraneum TaxID=3900 RepID=A0A2Z6LVC0_TRISU|nr:hypothetical protein TSUD_73790 [Trifolium subterraneum]
MALSIEEEVLSQEQFTDHVRVLAIDHDINILNTIEKMCSQFDYPVMCVDGSKRVVMKAVLNGACDYWIKPLVEDQIKYIWKHVAMKVFNETKQIGIDEKSGAEVKKELEKDDSKLPLIGATRERDIDNNATKENLEEDKDKTESPPKKARVIWSQELHKKFINALMELNIDKAVPRKILEKMNVPELTREQVASHLQS